MQINLYQVNMDRDENNVVFLGLDSLHKVQDSAMPNPEIYDKVFSGSVECKSLEEVYELFNLHHPADYKGRSLSVSDVVEIVSSEIHDLDPGFYFCDNIGFQMVPFAPEKTEDLAHQDSITVVYLEPGQRAQIKEIDSSLEGMQKLVGGYIEAFYPFEEEVCFVCNDEGKINGMQLNRAVYGADKEILDIIAGPCFICDCSGEDFGGLSQEQQQHYKNLFDLPEHFVSLNGNIMAIPYTPQSFNAIDDLITGAQQKTHPITSQKPTEPER